MPVPIAGDAYDVGWNCWRSNCGASMGLCLMSYVISRGQLMYSFRDSAEAVNVAGGHAQRCCFQEFWSDVSTADAFVLAPNVQP